jgi:hypothetical protein
MRGLRNAELLEIWERGFSQALTERALSLLAAACPDVNAEQLWALSIGQRDARLIALREALFGPDFEALASCPRCDRQLELNFSIADFHLDSQPEPDQEVTLNADGGVLRLRVPNSQDVLMASSREQLLQLCLPGVNVDHLPAEIVEAVEQKIVECDPLADIRMLISCRDCRHEWRVVFDIVSFLWSEVESWVGRILNEVHTLASAYGWSERDILSLSPARRQLYLNMVRT